MQKDGSVSQPKENTLRCLLRRTCKEISLADYKTCNFGKDYKSIIISGEPTEQELITAWEDVFFDYHSYLKSDDSSYSVLMNRDISLLIWHTTFVKKAIESLRLEYDIEIVEALRTEGYYENYEEPDRDKLEAIHNRILSLCKTKEFELETLQDEYARYLKEKDGGSDTTEEDFDKNIIMLSKYQGYPIDEEKTTAYKYVMIYNGYIADFNARNKEAE